MRRAWKSVFIAIIVAIAGLAIIANPPGMAAQPSTPGPERALPSEVPSTITPSVDDGRVFAIAQVGDSMVIGGSFTSVNSQGRSRVAAFDKTSGALRSFAPQVNGDINAVLPGPTANTVYIGGSFTQVGTTAARFVALLNISTGQVVPGFTAPNFNFGFVNDLVYRSDRLYVAGTFTRVNGAVREGLATLNPTTGALTPFLSVSLTGHHNDSGSGAQGWVGPSDIDVSADGSTLVAIGNFKYANGELRDQIVKLDLTGQSAIVDPNWATSRYQPYCFNWAFDTYMRGVSFSPDGSFFAVNTTGGGVTNTLCDSTARFETNGSGSDVQPTWVNESGGDTLWGVTVTDTAVYVGGHNRWSNNPYGSDYANAGAVPRPGLGALDPATGRPLDWNPGRRPLGVAVFGILATPEGVWIGSNNDWIGNYRYKRPKLAFFPYNGGYQAASTTTSQLPGTVYVGGGNAGGTTNVLYRVNAGGPSVQALDNGPEWSGDQDASSEWRSTGSNAAGWSPGATTTSNVPASTPGGVFDSERWSPSDNPAMDWAFPVAAGTPLEVRLYFANRCGCTSGVGQRVFDVDLDSTRVLDDYDIVADVGDQTGTVKKFNITSDGTVNIDFRHVNENPLINAIEIVRTDVTPTQPATDDGLQGVDFNGSTGHAESVSNQGVDFGSWRGAFKVGNQVYYGSTDGFLYSRSFVNGTFGNAVKIDPYHDPEWSDVQTDLGQTFVGASPTLYGQMPNVTGMAYAKGRLYYTLYGDSQLRWRWFTPDSGIMDERTFVVDGSFNFSNAGGMFIDGDDLYVSGRSDGNLRRLDFNTTSVSGSGSVVSGPNQDGVNWRGRATFLDGAPPAPANQPPVADFSSTCTGLDCAFNTNGSSDPDGTIASYSWNYGDGTTSVGNNPNHTYTLPGSYDVTLSVTDDDGATTSATKTVVVNQPGQAIAFVGAAHSGGGNRLSFSAQLPNSVIDGDTAIMFLTRPTPAALSGPAPVAGWQQVGSQANGSVTTTVWTKRLVASDAGKTVEFTHTAYTHASINIAVYRGVNATNPIAAITNNSTTSTATHTTPTATAPANATVVSFWGNRAQAPLNFNLPGSTETRDVSSDTGNLTTQGAIADSGPVGAGQVGGNTATTSPAADRSVNWTLVLRPE